eukprot:10912703-Alexandrium_andersonii.AAC.1
MNHLQATCANEHADLRPVLGSGEKYLFTQTAIPVRGPEHCSVLHRGCCAVGRVGPSDQDLTASTGKPWSRN